MREIVHLQVGQCGNQIGSKVINYKTHMYSNFFYIDVVKTHLPMGLNLRHYKNKKKQNSTQLKLKTNTITTIFFISFFSI